MVLPVQNESLKRALLVPIPLQWRVWNAQVSYLITSGVSDQDRRQLSRIRDEINAIVRGCVEDLNPDLLSSTALPELVVISKQDKDYRMDILSVESHGGPEKKNEATDATLYDARSVSASCEPRMLLQSLFFTMISADLASANTDNLTADYELLLQALPLYTITSATAFLKTSCALLFSVDTSDLWASQKNIALTILDWSRQEKVPIITVDLFIRIVLLCLKLKSYYEPFKYLTELMDLAKKLDDKLALVDAFLAEAKVHLALNSTSKSAASLTSARTNANAVNCSPLVQADIDLMSGILHAAEGDYETAFSYFYEAYGGLEIGQHSDVHKCVNYMILCRIMQDDYKVEDSQVAINMASNVSNRVDLMGTPTVTVLLDLARAIKSTNLTKFQHILDGNKELFKDDAAILSQLQILFTKCVKKNVVRLMIPYSKVHLSKLAARTNVEQNQIEKVVIEMILMGELSGTINQKTGHVILEDTKAMNPVYLHATQSFDALTEILSLVAYKSQKVHN